MAAGLQSGTAPWVSLSSTDSEWAQRHLLLSPSSAHSEIADTRHRPPPAKKPRSNPVITRYAPPPGYSGPAQPTAPYQQTGWQQPQQHYGYGQQVYPGYPNQGHVPPQQYQQPQYPAYAQQQQFPGGPQAFYPPPAQNYPGSHPQPWQYPASTPQSAPTHQHWTPTGSLNNTHRHNLAPYSTSKPSFTGPLDGNGDPLPPPQSQPGEDLEDDYMDECYFARYPDEINPALSLGFIEWQGALLSKLALPSTFAEAELEALAPRNPRPADEDSISDYFVKSKRDEVFLSVRQTERWPQIKEDLIFRDLPARCPDILSMSELLANYKDRPDPAWSIRAPSPTPTPEPDAAYIEAEPSCDTNGGAMDTDRHTLGDNGIKSERASESADVLGKLEQALQQNGTSYANHHSRANSAASVSSQRIARPKGLPPPPARDQAQEDILAALGVTGSPKIVYQTPGPAIGAPPPPPREGSTAGSSRQSSVNGNLGGFPIPPPPPGPAPQHRRFSDYDPWQVDGMSNNNGYNTERPGSNASQHTAAGSDFHTNDQDATPRPKLDRTDSRKRGFEASEDRSPDGGRQDDDVTPKQRRKQPRVDDAYW